MTQNDSGALKAIIVDDEALARQGLSMRLKDLEQVDVVQSCANAREALGAIIEHEPDLLFLDIQMPGKSGLEMIHEIQADIMPMIIFVTAYDSFAVDAFKIHAVDYLLKPIENEQLESAVAKASEQKAQKSAVGEKQRLLNLLISLTGKSASAIGCTDSGSPGDRGWRGLPSSQGTDWAALGQYDGFNVLHKLPE